MSTPTLDKHSAALDAAEDGASHLITVTFRIRRFNPEISEDASWEDFQLEIDPKERVLDALHKIKWELDGSLTFRPCRRHGALLPGVPRCDAVPDHDRQRADP